MGQFKNFLHQIVLEATIKEAPHGIFAKTTPTSKSLVEMVSYFNELGPLRDDLHATLVYTKVPLHDIQLPLIDRKLRFQAKVIGLDFWEGTDKQGNIVAILDSPDLIKLYKKFEDSLGRACLDGYEDQLFKFDHYQPHITLKHPVLNPSIYTQRINQYNRKLNQVPLKISLYYDGYTLLDPETD